MLVKDIYPDWQGNSIEVTQVTYNSQAIIPGAIFVALRGENTDGHKYISDAVSRGAQVAIVEVVDESLDVPQIKVANTQAELAVLAAHFYQTLNSPMQFVGITGTDGKTSTASIIEYLLADQKSVGYIGTNGVRFADRVEPHTLTTPLAPELHRIFSDMQKAEVDVVAMEVSSHALALHRVDTIDFDVAVFTNLTHDHLDFHGTFENYMAAKQLLFRGLGADKTAIINIDDPYAKQFAAATKAKVVYYGVNPKADYWAEAIEFDQFGSKFQLHTPDEAYTVRTKLLATFNIYNIMAAIASGAALGLDIEKMIARIEMMPAVDGRMELINEGQPFAVVVDFAHASAALENVLKFARTITANKLYVVIGAAGARDTIKRPVMGNVAVTNADVAVFTTDDPYFEDPDDIIDDMVAGMIATNYVRIVDRAEAIAYALDQAGPGDCVVVAGRGNYDILPIKGVDVHFNDIDFSREFLQKKYK
ncbi:UDP-N-acetylmuramoyl-L-alanyl-D-glutamate--2,6-diaminopimelate ligase [Culicoidibacter larvae]|uniref:UDP-N-acetylmuramyl-tripeptide synthetase n=1 Tax=Culicoidibacter larvae TaxID=2579976 RepID=A0A5R8Q8V9_9FIRM|nr:UDP-N-acetylmuramoyl-L-alanyl-D-glutamate--2,6-diaminopimelate ligase [Culicoidibacter larvae]TLG72141.1 UDP-N-acetylmuramoyl-L-alanyl-D-glutamate--2,6-diaminopimelate ligase [Culicoidibacter larvae]